MWGQSAGQIQPVEPLPCPFPSPSILDPVHLSSQSEPMLHVAQILVWPERALCGAVQPVCIWHHPSSSGLCHMWHLFQLVLDCECCMQCRSWDLLEQVLYAMQSSQGVHHVQYSCHSGQSALHTVPILTALGSMLCATWVTYWLEQSLDQVYWELGRGRRGGQFTRSGPMQGLAFGGKINCMFGPPKLNLQ